MTARGNPAGSACCPPTTVAGEHDFNAAGVWGLLDTGSLKGGMVFVPASSGSFTVPVAGLCAITGTAWWTQNTWHLPSLAVHNGAQVASSSG